MQKITFSKRSSIAVIIVLSTKIMSTYVQSIWQIISQSHSDVFPVTYMMSKPMAFSNTFSFDHCSKAHVFSFVIWEESPVEKILERMSTVSEGSVKCVYRGMAENTRELPSANVTININN